MISDKCNFSRGRRERERERRPRGLEDGDSNEIYETCQRRLLVRRVMEEEGQRSEGEWNRKQFAGCPGNSS